MTISFNTGGAGTTNYVSSGSFSSGTNNTPNFSFSFNPTPLSSGSSTGSPSSSLFSSMPGTYNFSTGAGISPALGSNLFGATNQIASPFQMAQASNNATNTVGQGVLTNIMADVISGTNVTFESNLVRPPASPAPAGTNVPLSSVTSGLPGEGMTFTPVSQLSAGGRAAAPPAPAAEAPVTSTPKVFSVRNLWADPAKPNRGFSSNGLNELKTLSVSEPAKALEAVTGVSTFSLPQSTVQNNVAPLMELLELQERRLNLEKTYGLQRTSGRTPSVDSTKLNTKSELIQTEFSTVLNNFDTKLQELRTSLRTGAALASTSTAQRLDQSRQALTTVLGKSTMDTLSVGQLEAQQSALADGLASAKAFAATLTPTKIDEQFFSDKYSSSGRKIDPLDPSGDAAGLVGRSFVNKDSPVYVQEKEKFIDDFFQRSGASRTDDPDLETRLGTLFDNTVLPRNQWDSVKKIQYATTQRNQRVSEADAIRLTILGPAEQELNTFFGGLEDRFSAANGTEAERTAARLRSSFNSRKSELDSDLRMLKDRYARGVVDQDAYETELKSLSSRFSNLRSELDFQLSDAENADYESSFWTRRSWTGETQGNWADNIIPALGVTTAAVLPLLTTFWLNPRERDRDFERQKQLMDLQHQYWLSQLEAQTGAAIAVKGSPSGGGGGTPEGNPNIQLAQG